MTHGVSDLAHTGEVASVTAPPCIISGLSGKATRQIGIVAKHHETSRALTLCCVEAVGHE